MRTERYILDANVLTRLTATQRSSDFVRQNCSIPTEVLHEVRGLPDHESLREMEFAVSATVLTHLTEVLRTMRPGDFKLIDLYANKGNADPFLVACALAGKRESEGMLFPTEWIVVSDDLAVRSTASEHGLAWLSTEAFVAMLGEE